jgi:hypothetical protein
MLHITDRKVTVVLDSYPAKTHKAYRFTKSGLVEFDPKR